MLKQVTQYVVMLGFVLLTACAAQQTQMNVANEFWTAMVSNDLDKAKKYVKTDNINEIDVYDTLAIEKVNLKPLMDANDNSSVLTTILLNEGGQQKPIVFHTILDKEDGNWKIDFDKTKKSMHDASILNPK